MKKNLNIQQKLILPIALLGVVALISNLLAASSIHLVHTNAANIVEDYMVSWQRSAARSWISTKWPSPTLSPRITAP